MFGTYTQLISRTVDKTGIYFSVDWLNWDTRSQGKKTEPEVNRYVCPPTLTICQNCSCNSFLNITEQRLLVCWLPTFIYSLVVSALPPSCRAGESRHSIIYLTLHNPVCWCYVCVPAKEKTASTKECYTVPCFERFSWKFCYADNSQKKTET